jgi:hypothetical protein
VTQLKTSLGHEFNTWLRETKDLDDLREAIDVIRIALGDRTISPRYAGLMLQAIEDRRRQIAYPDFTGQILLQQTLAKASTKKRKSRGFSSNAE